MNKKLAAALQQHGMTVTGNSAYGTVHGYEMSLRAPSPMEQSAYFLHVSFYASEEKKQEAANEIARFGNKLRVENSAYGLTITLPQPVFTLNPLIEAIGVLFEKLPALFKQKEIPGADVCPYDGNPMTENSKRCVMNGFFVTLNNDCIGSINKAIEEENRLFANAPNNYLQGICGALVGGVVGAALVIALYFMEYVASISAIIAVMLGAFLYRKFGGKPNAVMIVIVSVISHIFILIGYYAAVIIDIISEFSLDFGSAVELLNLNLAENPEFSKLFYTNLALLLVFTALGIGVMIFSLVRQIKRPKNIG